MLNLRGENCQEEAVGIKFFAIRSIVKEKVPKAIFNYIRVWPVVGVKREADSSVCN